jgi:hypothetical protein
VQIRARSFVKDLAVLADRLDQGAVPASMLLPGEEATIVIASAADLDPAALMRYPVLRTANDLFNEASYRWSWGAGLIRTTWVRAISRSNLSPALGRTKCPPSAASGPPPSMTVAGPAPWTTRWKARRANSGHPAVDLRVHGQPVARAGDGERRTEPPAVERGERQPVVSWSKDVWVPSKAGTNRCSSTTAGWHPAVEAGARPHGRDRAAAGVDRDAVHWRRGGSEPPTLEELAGVPVIPVARGQIDLPAGHAGLEHGRDQQVRAEQVLVVDARDDGVVLMVEDERALRGRAGLDSAQEGCVQVGQQAVAHLDRLADESEGGVAEGPGVLLDGHRVLNLRPFCELWGFAERPDLRRTDGCGWGWRRAAGVGGWVGGFSRGWLGAGRGVRGTGPGGGGLRRRGLGP